MTKRDALALLKSGAFDSLLKCDTCSIDIKRQYRADLESQLKGYLKYAKSRRVNPNQMLLFANETIKFNDNVAEPWEKRQLLEYEYEYLGRYLSGHPVDEYRAKAKRLGIARIAELQNEDETHMVCALVRDINEYKAKNDELMCFLELEDETGTISTTVFSRDYDPQQFEIGDIAYFYIKTGSYRGRFTSSYIKSRRAK